MFLRNSIKPIWQRFIAGKKKQLNFQARLEKINFPTDRIPKELLDPTFLNIMEEPVLINNEHTVDLSALQQWQRTYQRTDFYSHTPIIQIEYLSALKTAIEKFVSAAETIWPQRQALINLLQNSTTLCKHKMYLKQILTLEENLFCENSTLKTPLEKLQRKLKFLMYVKDFLGETPENESACKTILLEIERLHTSTAKNVCFYLKARPFDFFYHSLSGLAASSLFTLTNGIKQVTKPAGSLLECR